MATCLQQQQHTVSGARTREGGAAEGAGRQEGFSARSNVAADTVFQESPGAAGPRRDTSWVDSIVSLRAKDGHQRGSVALPTASACGAVSAVQRKYTTRAKYARTQAAGNDDSTDSTERRRITRAQWSQHHSALLFQHRAVFCLRHCRFGEIFDFLNLSLSHTIGPGKAHDGLFFFFAN